MYASPENNQSMLSPGSRYYREGSTSMQLPDGRHVAYLRRRFLPRGVTLPVVRTVPVTSGLRPDLAASRYLGDSSQYWRICDANDAMDPAVLFGQVGYELRIPGPSGALKSF